MAWRVTAPLCTATMAAECVVSVPGLGDLTGTDIIPGQVAPFYSNVAGFYGIPYAKPPVGDLRWQPPQPHGAWTSPRNAQRFGKACMQKENTQYDGDVSEDCLFLNVATPRTAIGTEKTLPVMFWIHGGAYTMGSSGVYPIESLVSSSNHSVVVVATNYRLGVFGFLGGSEVAAVTSDGGSGNFGIQDQRLAMTWIRDHIGAFGGDKSEVTIFGQSAGGNSVMHHLATTASFGLYKRAIVESGTYTYGATDMASAESDYAKTLKDLGCQDLQCLRSVEAAKLLSKGGGLLASPVIDGVSLSDDPWHIVRQGKHNKEATVVVGSVRDEGALITAKFPQKLNVLEFDVAVGTVLKALGKTANVANVKKVYDPSVYTYPADLGDASRWWWELTRVATDTVPGLGACGTRSYARDLLAGGSKKVYTYLFAKPSLNAFINPSETFVAHAAEVGFVFGDTQNMTTPAEKELALAMASYWSAFAVNDDPNHDGLPEWPEFAAESDTNLRFDDSPSLRGIFTQSGLRKSACDYWDSVEAASSLDMVV